MGNFAGAQDGILGSQELLMACPNCGRKVFMSTLLHYEGYVDPNIHTCLQCGWKGTKKDMDKKSLQDIQTEIGEWSYKTFGDNVSKTTGQKLYSQNALTGLVEEVGELNRCVICRHQGRRGYDNEEKYRVDVSDALADILIFLCDFAYREGFNLQSILNTTWNNIVSKRTLDNWEQHTHEKIEQTGQGFAEPKELPE